ncbi:hypothetical protein MJO28_005738 [Puccinia striiformis f. sp. tritici]|uniref:Uncharacterized protein n=1 Tax=Puccinia striiformis f. sp. tritici TaxID=168172 RepID=A0ACC0EL40_9BASI|nr:hypothetical protein Pst134EA_009845 [Puccinia striiformis f. sp. tritici]KAH9469323.1 hypothetical protein Pst134EA_009845 [Puccinia striiformis f. sp. tritici]KAI7955338.1 hypothetical protein MJO28_005738 [Puccinia striiformis f. sp. tritici]KAI7960689.1 hypothetical protein MJO29_005757 [Puccinia striiformis f. sp. tritici]
MSQQFESSFQKATRRRTKTWTLKVLIGSIIIVFSLGGVGRASGKASERLRGAGRQGRTDNFEEKIFCRTSSPIRANRDEILKFIESFCAEATGQEFGGSEGNLELKELYSVEPSQRANGMATHVLLQLRSINGCKFSVDYSCGRFLTRPTDECNIGNEAKQGGFVSNGCSLWKTIPMAI